MARLNRDEGDQIRLHQGRPAPSDDPITYPNVPLELLTYLREQFVDRLPPKGTDIRDVDFMTGQQDIIGHLAELFQRQKDDALPNVLL